MLGFKIWSRFGVFRDPLTITQNITFPLPPKTTVGGMMAAILGIDYNEYFRDSEYFSFEYAVVPLGAIRKRSYAQNYINDYTKTSSRKLSGLGNASDHNENDAEKIRERFTSPKPIFRELLCEPAYLIFVRNFKHEERLRKALNEHTTEFALYMGNSEFPANIQSVQIISEEVIEETEVHSFTLHPELLEFEARKRYTSLHFATRASDEREYSEYVKIIFSESGVKLKKAIDAVAITTKENSYVCEFV
jgi:CRISPR-associated protein Cas5h